MSKKAINQNANYDSELLNSIESNFYFDENPINRFKNNTGNLEKVNGIDRVNKGKELKGFMIQGYMGPEEFTEHLKELKKD